VRHRAVAWDGHIGNRLADLARDAKDSRERGRLVVQGARAMGIRPLIGRYARGVGRVPGADTRVGWDAYPGVAA